MKTVHIAGTQIVIGKYNIQRCMICGEALILDDLSRIAVAIDDKEDKKEKFNALGFNTGSIVEVDKKVGGINKYITKIGDLPEQFKIADLPKNICLDLLEL